MTFKWNIDPDAGLICKRGEGEVTEDALLTQLLAETEHAAFRPGLCKLVDYRELKPRVSGDGIRRLARAVGRLEDRIGAARWAVVTDDDLVYGLVRMFMAHVSDLQLRIDVFRNVDEARSWLGLSPDGPCPLSTEPDRAGGRDRHDDGTSPLATNSQLAHPPLQRRALQPEDRRGARVAA